MQGAFHSVIELKLNMLGREFSNVPAFIIPNSDYHTMIPLLVGTNVIRASRNPLQPTYGQFLHRVKERHPEWYTAILVVGGDMVNWMTKWVLPFTAAARSASPGGRELI